LKLEFTKMNGAANDFVMIDGINNRVSLSDGRVRLACDRRRGVGADGLIVLKPSSEAGFDFHMEYYNSDGFPAEMCGNGSRCAARFGSGLGLGSPDGDGVHVRFSTDSGPIDAWVCGERVRAGLMDAREMRRKIPVRVAQDVKIVHFIVVGTRHAVVFVDEARDINGDDIRRLGRIVRNDPEFGPVGANVNFASIGESGRIHLRTYEKGVEAETYACGTGSVAAAVLFAHDGRLESPVNVLQHSGDELTVSFRLAPDGATDVTLEGPVATNFAGTLEL
jgi:diaminopimelate epimerase